MIKSKKQIEILKSWNKMKLPSPGSKMMFKYLNTNLWIFKTSDNTFGFLISGTMGQLSNIYKNVGVSWQPQVVDKINKIRLEDCLIIEAGKNIDSSLFCSNISFLFEIQDKHHLFKVEEVEEAFKKIEEITSKESDEFNESIGAWGELYLINELIKNSINGKRKLEIIESWEGVDARSKIDFHFKSVLTKIEVKTTIESIRMHHFNGLDQVEKGPRGKGFLASICVKADDNGLSCNDLVESIEKNLTKSHISIWERKIKIRGEVCGNRKYKFAINTLKEMQFFDFSEVPKPVIAEGVGKMQWDATLENRSYLNAKEKFRLVNKMI